MTRRRCCALYCGLLLATGCLPYGYPKLAYVPGYDPTNVRKAAEVHAFRVDVTTDRADLSETAEWSITEIARTSDGRFPPQTRLSVERGFNVFGPLTYNVGRSHTTRVRLYSPGHQLVELDSWDFERQSAVADHRGLERPREGDRRLGATTATVRHQEARRGVARERTGVRLRRDRVRGNRRERRDPGGSRPAEAQGRRHSPRHAATYAMISLMGAAGGRV